MTFTDDPCGMVRMQAEVDALRARAEKAEREVRDLKAGCLRAELAADGMRADVAALRRKLDSLVAIIVELSSAALDAVGYTNDEGITFQPDTGEARILHDAATKARTAILPFRKKGGA